MNEARTSLVLLSEGSSTPTMVKMKDGDTFFIAMTDAARACRVFDCGREFSTQFQELMILLHTWIETNIAKVKSAHLTFQDRGGILFLVMQKGEAFDRALSDAMTELDLSVANNKDFALIDMDVLLIPSVSADSMSAFLASGDFYTYAK
jgi:hypothetical protein